MGGHKKYGYSGFNIGTVGTQYSPGNHVLSGGHYEPTGSYFEATGRERRIGPSYLATMQHKSFATGVSRSALPDRTVLPTGAVYGKSTNVPGMATKLSSYHTERPTHNYNLRSLVGTPWAGYTKAVEATI